MERIQVEKIEHVAINVTDVERARGFYAGVLGLVEVERPRSFDFPGAWFRNGPCDLHLVARAEVDAPSKRHVAFLVADVELAARVLREAGYPVLWETKKIEGYERFFTEDPDGNRVEVMGRG